MKPSKLELYIEILKTLGQQHLVQLANIQEKTRVDTDNLKERMQFLVEQGLIEQRKASRRLSYKNTQKGIRVLNYFKKQAETKHFGKWVSQ